MSHTSLSAVRGGVASLQGKLHVVNRAPITQAAAQLHLPTSIRRPPAVPATPLSLGKHCRPASRSLSLSSGRAAVTAMSALSYPEPTVFDAKGEHKATVIIMHGLGDTAAGWASMGQMFAMPGAKFVFPTAPMRPITLNMGMVMTGWYDITSLDKINNEEDADGIRESWRYVEGLIKKEEEAGIPSDKIIVAGFSQGGAVAMMGARSSKKLAGIIGMSTYMPLRNEDPVISPENMDTPILMCHGERDMVVNYAYGKESATKLKDLGANVTFLTYPYMGHEACLEELEEVKSFIAKVIGG